MKSHSAAQVTWWVKPGYQAMVTPSAKCSSASVVAHAALVGVLQRCSGFK
jgi:hypothetical protein